MSASPHASSALSEQRAVASRVARTLLDKGRADDAVAVLAAWASGGANDAEGQELLAEALRIDPAARLAQLAFERMEGIAGDHTLLDDAIRRWSVEELARVEGELTRPAFVRAQVGFNNNVKYRELAFHIQTEDSGLDKPHVITHLFADGGRVIKSHKRSYANEVRRGDVAAFVRSLMKAQQLEMALGLREGRFDDIIDGKVVGGMEVLDYPPKVDVQKLATRKKSRVQADGATEEAPPAASKQAAPAPAAVDAKRVLVRLRVLRGGDGGSKTFYEPRGGEAVIGASGAIDLAGERFCHPYEAEIRRRDGRLWLRDFEAGNGVFLRIKAPVLLEAGDDLIVGNQVLRVERNPMLHDGPDPGPTYFYSSPKWLSSFRLVQIFEGGARGACVLARGTTLQIGSAVGDLVFPSDPLLSGQHCLIEEQADSILLTDLGSNTGVFVRIKGEQELASGDEILVGRTCLSVEVPAE